VIASTTYLLYRFYSNVDFHHLKNIQWNNLYLRDFYPMIHQNKVEDISYDIMMVLFSNTIVLYVNPGFQNDHWNIVFYNIGQIIFIYTLQHCHIVMKIVAFYHMVNLYDYFYYIQKYIPNKITQIIYQFYRYSFDYLFAFYTFLVFKECMLINDVKVHGFERLSGHGTDNHYHSAPFGARNDEQVEYIVLITILYFSIGLYVFYILELFFPNIYKALYF
jgi:hypothetical protein